MLVVFSVLLLVILINLWSWRKKIKSWSQRSTKKNVQVIVKTILIFSLVIFVNIWVINHNQRWDITENQIHSLSSLSEKIVKQLKYPLEVLIFDRNINLRIKKLLDKYQRVSSQFQFRFINPEQELGLARELGVQSLGEIYLKYNNQIQKLKPNTFNPRDELTEKQLTNGIEKIKRETETIIYLLQGHGESPNDFVARGIAQIVQNLENKGNIVSELNLAAIGKVPENSDLIIIAGATRKLLAAEANSLQQYLLTGGNLLLLLSPKIDINITPLLQEWGIELDNRLIVDGSGAGEAMGFGPGVAIVNQYGNHPITNSFNDGISIFPESRPLKVINKTGIQSTSLAITSKQTWAESDLNQEEITFDVNRDLSGPFNIGIACKRNIPDISRLVVFGSSTFATNGWYEQQLNSDLLLNSINWLIGEETEVLAIQPRESTNRRINLTSIQLELIDWLALSIFPMSALIIAAFIWYKLG